MSFQLPNLPYAYDALEPYIDARTMEIHYTKHHNGYLTKLNAAVEGTDLAGKSIETILKGMDMNNAALRNNGGGYYNHCLFWEAMSPKGGGEPSGQLATAIKDRFGSFGGFKEAFSYPGFIPAYIRPLFCEGKGPFRWVALSGEEEDIYTTDQVIMDLFPEDQHLHHVL